MWAGHDHLVTLSRPCMKMDPSLHLVSDQTSAEVRGRTAEFEELVHAEHVGLFRALALITRDSAEAEDVMQEAFLRVWERWGRAPTLVDPPGYLSEVRRAGLEPATRCLEGSRSVQTELPALTPNCRGQRRRTAAFGSERDEAVFEQAVVLYPQTL